MYHEIRNLDTSLTEARFLSVIGPKGRPATPSPCTVVLLVDWGCLALALATL